MKNRRDACERLALLKSQYDEIVVDASRLTAAYLGGLFDAEGCARIGGHDCIRLQITQSSSPPLLGAILEQWPGGSIDNGAVAYCGAKGDALLADLLEHSLGKLDQLHILAQHRQDQRDWQSEHGKYVRRGDEVLRAWKDKVARRKAQLAAMKRK